MSGASVHLGPPYSILRPRSLVASTKTLLTLTFLAVPKSSEIGVRVIEEISGAAVAYDCSGVYVDTDS